MSHFFVSYAHDDKAHLDALLQWMYSQDINEREIWYDHHIEEGSIWSDEIIGALNHASMVILIVTGRALKSDFCSFEWAYAMGQGIPVLPLYFEEFSSTAMLPPLASKQYVDCRQQIPESLKTIVSQYRTVSPRIEAINRAVYDAVYDTHRRYYILGWMDDEFGFLGEYDVRYEIANYFVKHAEEARDRLIKLMTDNSSSITSKQYRMCWQLIDNLRDMTRNLPLYFDDRSLISPQLFGTFDTRWLPAFEYFEGKWSWRRWIRRSFEEDLSDEDTKLEVLGEILRVFPMLHASDVSYLINNVWNRKQKGNRSTSN